MNNPTKLLAAGAAAALAGLANAQVDYSFNWQTPNNGFLGGLGFTDGPGLFGGLAGDGHFATTGDAIRVCYGIDSTQGGMNQGGNSSVTWFRLVGAYPAGNTIQAVNFGLTSIASSSVDSLDGDACFSPFFAQGNDSVSGAAITQNTASSFSFVPGTIAGTAPFPNFWFIYFNFLGSTGLQTANTLGTEPAGLGGFADPLLTNLIFEVQGPLNFGPSANAYFLAATSERIGLGSGGTGTGGVTNGNGQMGFSLSGTTADLSDAVAHHRLTSLDLAGNLNGFFGVSFAGAGSTQWFGGVATESPALWANTDGFTGGGGSDLSIGSSVSTFQWRLIDQLAGGEANPAAVAFDPSLLANVGLALYSRAPGVGMLQTPMSWDTLGGAAPGQPGSIILGPQFTTREGLQTVPANFDPLLLNILNNQPALTFGNAFTASVDPNADGDASALFDDGVGVGGPGQSTMPNAVAISAAPNPALSGVKIGLAAVGIQFDGVAGTVGVTEVASAMTLNLQ